jgi:hypothetical protein
MDDTQKKETIKKFCNDFDKELDPTTADAIATGLTGTKAKTKA